MRLVLQPNLWSCLPAAFATALGCELEFLLDKVGHDGSRIVWPALGEPLRRRSFHIQEMVWVAHGMGVSVTPFEIAPAIAPPGARPLEVEPLGNFEALLLVPQRAVITGVAPSGGRHAVAWDGREVYCPSGRRYAIEDFGIEVLWSLREIKAA